jgi:hypothetical protein
MMSEHDDEYRGVGCTTETANWLNGFHEGDSAFIDDPPPCLWDFISRGGSIEREHARWLRNEWAARNSCWRMWVMSDAIGCGDGDDVARAAAASVRAGDMPPAVGDILSPADFGSGEGCDGGVLRLAALLAEAPIGATVRDCSLCEHVKTDSGWGRLDHRRDETDYDLALYFAPLTVIEWPAYGPARPAS